MNNKKRISILLVCILAIVTVLGLTACDPDTCEHSNTTYEVVTPATCETAGVQHKKCVDCGEVVGSDEAIAALGHNYQNDATASVAATCTAAGKTVEKCANCGDVKTTTVAPAHNFAEKADECKAPTCIAKGQTVLECSLCNAKQTTIVDELGHDWHLDAALTGASTIVAGDCVARTCSVCNEKQAGIKPHDYQEISDTATCAAAGVKTFQCKGCNDTYEEVSEALGHDVEVWNEDTAFTPVLVDAETCTYKFGLVGTCTVCNEDQKDTYEAVAHNYVIDVVAEATCDAPGKKNLVCSVCDDVKEGSAPITYYVDHNYGAADASGKSTCSECGATKQVFSGNEANITNKDDLKQEIELGTGAVIKLPDTVADSVSGNATLSATNHAKGDIPAGTPGLDRVGADDEVFDLSLTDGENAVTTFDGKVLVKLPYVLSPDEDPTRVVIFYLGAERIEFVDAVFTETNADGDPNTKDGFVAFETGHFSYYLVGLYKDSELCERFGHQYLVSKKDATCTTAGYYIETCKRCGGYGMREIYPATGHIVEILATSVPATCTEKGHTDLKCTVCQAQFTKVEIALGHEWVAGETVAATCKAPGSKTETCARCDAAQSIALAQRPHILKTTVVAPTCTAGGYTEHSCANCDLSYTDELLPAAGHAWDLAAPTCAEGQTCLTCGVAGDAATGNHNMVDGQCSVCGYGCNHTDTVKQTIAPTCTVGGYTVKVCSKCGREVKTDITNATGHSFPNDLDACTVCEAVNPAFAESVKNMLASLASTSYALKIEDVEIKVSDIYDDASELLGTITIVPAEFYIVSETVGEGEEATTLVKFYINGDFSAITAGTNEIDGGKATVYGDGTYVYAALEVKGMLNKESLTARFSYDTLIDAAITAITSQGNQGENGSGNMGGSNGGDYEGDHQPPVQEEMPPAVEIKPAAYSTDGAMSIEEMIEGYIAMITETLENPIVAPWVELVSKNEMNIYAALGQSFFSFFEGTKIDGGYRYDFKFDMFKQFNEDLYTLTLTQFIDKNYGEGTTDAIFAYIDTAKDKRIVDFFTELLILCDEKGIPSELVIETINSVVTMMMQPDEPSNDNPQGPMPALMADNDGETFTFDLRAFLNKTFQDYTLLDIYNMLAAYIEENPDVLPPIGGQDQDRPDSGETSASEKIEIPEFAELLKAARAFLDETVVYDLIEEEELREYIYESYASLFDDEHVHYYFVLDEDGNFVSFNFGYTDYTFKVMSESDNEISYGAADINFDVTLLFDTTIPAAAEAFKAEFDAQMAKLDASAKAALVAEDENAVGMFEVVDGKLYVFMLVNGEDVSVEVATIPGIVFMSGCTNEYGVMVFSEVMPPNMGMFYFNHTANTFSFEASHIYGEAYTGALPAGFYHAKDFDTMPCNAEYGYFYQCSCGRLAAECRNESHLKYGDCDGIHEKQHLHYSKYEFLNANQKNCEDGLRVSGYCYYCDELLSSYTIEKGDVGTYSHPMSERIVEFETYCGTLYVKVMSCPCGWTGGVRIGNLYCANGNIHESNESGVWSDACIFSAYENGGDVNGGQGGPEIREYLCAVTDCDTKIKITIGTGYSANVGGSPCAYRYVDKIELYDGETLLGTYNNTETTTQHRPESFAGEGNHWKCTVCGYEYYNMWKYDQYGRLLEHKTWSKNSKGEYLSFYHEKRVFTGCNYVEYRSERYNEPLKEKHRGTDHAETNVDVLYEAGTCTQPSVWIVNYDCAVCDYTKEGGKYYSWKHLVDEYGKHDYGHNWVKNTDENAEFAYYCSHCGLESDKNASYISLEDLTGSSKFGQTGSIVIGYSSYDYWNEFNIRDFYQYRISLSFIPKAAAGDYANAEGLPLGLTTAQYLQLPGQYKQDDDFEGFGRFALDMNAIREDIAALIANGATSAQTVEEFLASYDLAIQMEPESNLSIGDGEEGKYAVIVITDLAQKLG